MDSFFALVLATLLFGALHFAVSGTPLRGRLVAALGERPYLGLFSLLSLVALVWMAYAYGRAPTAALWASAGLRHLVLLVMPLALIFLVAGVAAPNPTATHGEGALASGEAHGIFRVTRHPIMWGVGLWGLAHLLANGDSASLVFFGGLTLVALFGPLLIDAKMRRASPPGWERFAATTSWLPFAAIVRGRNRLALAEIGWWRIALALALYVVLLFVHPWLFGAPVLP